MADYKEKEVAGKSWQRACRVMIENPYGGTPTITFVEEEATQLGQKVTMKDCGSVGVQFDPQNPTHIQIYTILNELYMALAANRDAAQAVPEG